MAKVPTQIEHYEDRGTVYTITVEPVRGGYGGRWRCHSCGGRGGSGGIFKTAKLAIDQTKINLYPHTSRDHPQGVGT
jgi:hypothetical protein